MARLLLKFEGEMLKEVPVGSRAVSIGRAPENDIPIDNPAVSNHHARVYTEAGKLVVEDLNSLNGTFLNDQRIERAALRHGDAILVGKHHVVVDETHDAAVPVNSGRKVPTPKVDETMVLDTKQRRELLQQAVAAGERSQIAPTRMRMPTLAILSGKTDQKEYLLSGKLTVIGKSPMATVRLRGWFVPRAAAQINKREDGYYLGRGDRVPKVNGAPITAPTRLNEGDLIEVAGVRMNFLYRD